MNATTQKLDLSAMLRPAAWDRVAHHYAEVVATHLEHYAADALTLAGVVAGERVLDVATGPGTLARLAARVAEVQALDFSNEMLEALRRRATPEELRCLDLKQGDGQALPYDDGHFDAGFSMFGLFMFPDRALGFAELRRVLKPGGRAVVATWQPQDEIRPFVIINRALAQEIEAPPGGPPPLSDPQDLRAELEDAGFSDVDVKPVTHTLSSESTDEMWAGLERSHVSLGIARDQLSAGGYEKLVAKIRRQLAAELGTGPQELVMRAWLGFGRVASA